MPTDTLKLDVALKGWLIQCCYGVQICVGIIIYIVSNDAAAYIDTNLQSALNTNVVILEHR